MGVCVKVCVCVYISSVRFLYTNESCCVCGLCQTLFSSVSIKNSLALQVLPDNSLSITKELRTFNFSKSEG